MTRRLAFGTMALLLAALGALLIYALRRVDAPPPPPTPAPTERPAPSASGLSLEVRASAHEQTITFELRGTAREGAQEALLWYDAESGFRPHRIKLDGSTSFSRSVTISTTTPLTRTAARDAPVLDYWWAVRDRAGQVAQRAGSLELRPEQLSQVPPPFPLDFAWAERTIRHMTFRYAPGTAAARDIDQLAEIAERSYPRASSVISGTLIGAAPVQPPTMTIYLVPRVFWQGGVAYGSTLVISYLDRNYVDVVPWVYLVHEMVHGITNAAGDGGHGSGGAVLGEGAAVFASGGHYHSLRIRESAAALRRLGHANSLCELRGRFDQVQHEQAYLQSAAFVQYLIERFGQKPFLQKYLVYGVAEPGPGESQASYCERLSTTLAQPFGVTYGELERDWETWLASASPTLSETQIISGSLRFYDLVRRYEEQRDPAARVLPPSRAEDWGRQQLVSFHSPTLTPTNVLQETMLIAAHRALLEGDDHATALMDEVEQSIASGALDGPLGTRYEAARRLLEELARARRLGDEQSYQSLLAPQAKDHSPDAALYQRYEVELQQLRLQDGGATGLIQLDAQPLEGAPTTGLYAFELQQHAAGWRLARLEPAQPALERPPPPLTLPS